MMVAAISVAIGILISAQWRSVPERVTNPISPYLSLTQTKDSLSLENDQLRNEITTLQQEIEKSQKAAEDIALSKTELLVLQNEKARAGLTKLNGPGIIITYDDSKFGELGEASIVHAADLRDTINLLWGSGAEGITINNQRIVLNTAIDCIVNTILINGTKIGNPFRIEAIGDETVMFAKLSDRTNLVSLYDRKINQGLVFNIEKNNDITVPVYNGSFELQAKGQ